MVERHPNTVKEAPVKGISPKTYEFLVTSIQVKAYKDLDIRQRNLIGIYFGTDASLAGLTTIAEVTSAYSVGRIIKSGLESMWNSLPEELREKHSIEDAIALKHTNKFTPESRDKMSNARIKGWQDPEYKQMMRKKMSDAAKSRTQTEKTKVKISQGY